MTPLWNQGFICDDGRYANHPSMINYVGKYFKSNQGMDRTVFVYLIPT